MFKAAIFDAGGVLQTYEVMEPIFEDITSELGISREEFDLVWKEYSNKLAINAVSEHDFFVELIKRTGSSKPVPTESLLSRKYGEFFAVNQDTLKIVDDLRSKGLKLAVLTNSIKPHTEYNRKAGLYDHFDVCITSNEVEVRKPDLEIYQICLEKLGVEASDAFMVDDKQRNLDPAEELGIKGILFISPEQLRSELEEMKILGD